MNRYDHIALIYNPKSTGNALARAKQLASQIKSNKKSIAIEAVLTPTDYAGHARLLAKEISLSYDHPLIISVSGDGGYNEVINGIMAAKEANKSISPVAAVFGAGNANDHMRASRGKTSLVELILNSKPQAMNIMKLTARAKKVTLIRYAHSYIGLGISSKAGYELNKHGKTRYKEAFTILKTFWNLQPIEIKVDNSTHKIDSLIFANIGQMAKVMKLNTKTKLQNNKFEVIIFNHLHKPHLIFNLLKSVLWHANNGLGVESYQFSTTTSEKVQLDGEVETIPANADIYVESISDVVQSLYVP